MRRGQVQRWAAAARVFVGLVLPLLLGACGRGSRSSGNFIDALWNLFVFLVVLGFLSTIFQKDKKRPPRSDSSPDRAGPGSSSPPTTPAPTTRNAWSPPEWSTPSRAVRTTAAPAHRVDRTDRTERSETVPSSMEVAIEFKDGAARAYLEAREYRIAPAPGGGADDARSSRERDSRGSHRLDRRPGPKSTRPSDRWNNDEDDDEGDSDEYWDDEDERERAARRAIRNKAADRLTEDAAAASAVQWFLASAKSRDGGMTFALRLVRPPPYGPIVLFVECRPDCALATGASRSRAEPPSQVVVAAARIRGSHGHGDTRPFPATLAEQIGRLRPRDEFAKDVSERLRRWSSFLDVERKLADSRRFEIRFTGRRFLPEGRVQVTLEPRSTREIELLARYRGRIDLTGPDPSLARRGHPAEVVSYDPATRVLRLELRPHEDGDRVDPDRVPPTGRIVNAAVGELEQINRQERAIRTLVDGAARLPNLHDLLFGDREMLDLPEVAEAESVPLDSCLARDRINPRQRLAVGMALATPDCFLLQGPPGTGKTTFIAELCYQLAHRGKRVLVASQANLAVDNALSRLERDPSILATRLGPSEKIEEEGRPFVGDNAISRWLHGIAQRVGPRAQQLRDAIPFARELVTHRDALLAWAAQDGDRRLRAGPTAYTQAQLEEAMASLTEARRAFDRAREVLEAAADRANALAAAERRRDTEAEALARAKLRLAGAQQLRRSPMTPEWGSDHPEEILQAGQRWRRARAAVLGSTAEPPPEGDASGSVDNWVSAERLGDTIAAESALRGLERRAAHLHAASQKGLGRWWNRLRWGLLRRRQSAAAVEVERGVFGPVSDRWTWVERAIDAFVERREEEARRRSDSLASARREAERLDSERRGANESVCAALEGVERVAPSDRNVRDDRSAAALRRAIGDAKDARDLAVGAVAIAVWGRARTKLPLPTLLDTERPATGALRDLIDAIAEGRGVCAPSRLEEAAKLLDQWVERLTAGGGGIGPELRRVFDAGVNVVGCTCSFVGSREFQERFSEFDTVVVDEVSKATPTELLIPCLLGRRVVLVGDHKQLPPFAPTGEGAYDDLAEDLGLTKQELRAELARSLFKERFEFLDPKSSVAEDLSRGRGRTLTLTQQYRMHSQIMAGVNYFYGGRLEMGDPRIDAERSHGLPEGTWTRHDAHVVWIDVPAAWESELVGTSWRNVQEARTVARVVEQLERAGLPAGLDVGVISMYAEQAFAVRREIDAVGLSPAFRGRVRVSTVDRFQGMERDIVVVSLALCGPDAKLSSFLRTGERINVAMSRARRLLVIVGSSDTFVRLAGRGSPYGHFYGIARTDGVVARATDVLG